MIRDHSDHGRSNEPMNPCPEVDSSVHLIYHDPSDLGSLILIGIVPKNAPLVKGAVSLNSAKLENYKIPIKLRET